MFVGFSVRGPLEVWQSWSHRRLVCKAHAPHQELGQFKWQAVKKT